MKSFKQFLIEAKMTRSEAFSILGITSGTSQDELKKIYRKLSIENHPDRGGDTEKMAQLNAAYEVAKKNVGTGGVEDMQKTRDDNTKKIKEALIYILSDIDMKLRPDLFKNYFEMVFKKPFTYTVTKYPDLKEMDTKYGMPHGAGVIVEFKDQSKDTSIIFRITGNAHGLAFPKKTLSGAPDQSYDLFTDIEIFHDNKKNKLKRADWNSTNDHKVFNDPESLFPLVKMKKIAGGKAKSKKFTKADAILFTKRKMEAKPYIDDFFIPVYDNKVIEFKRNVMMRQAFWVATGLYDKPKFGLKLDMKNRFESLYFKESEENFIAFNNAVNKLKKHKDIKKFTRDIDKLRT